MKRIFALLLVLCMTFSLAACGEKEDVGSSVTTHQGFELTEADGVSGDPMSVKMPSRIVDTKELLVYTWVEEVYSETPDIEPGPFDTLKSDYGVETTVHVAAQANYWSNLATLIAADSAPDLVQVPNWDYYPEGITTGCLQPLDDIINFDKPLWESSKDLIDQFRWTDGKAYFTLDETVQNWLFFNKKIFADAGLKNPYEYYIEGNWTYDVLKELCTKLKKEENGKVTLYPLSIQENIFFASAGIELVELDKENGYKFNLRDEKIAKVMNHLYDLGNGGLKAIGGDPATFRQQTVAMITGPYWMATNNYNKIRLAGNLGWVPPPALDSDSEVYNSTMLSTGYAIVKGAKNVNAAALAIELYRWRAIGGYNGSVGVPFVPVDRSKSPYYTAFPEANSTGGTDPDKQLTAEEIEYSKQFSLEKVEGISAIYGSWLGTTNIGVSEVTDIARPWSQVLEELYPKFDSILKSYFEE